MNNMRKLMEMVEAGELGSVPTSNNDVEINGQGIILYEDQVAIYDEAGEYQIFLPIKTWNAFVKASKNVSESINENDDFSNIDLDEFAVFHAGYDYGWNDRDENYLGGGEVSIAERLYREWKKTGGLR